MSGSDLDALPEFGYNIRGGCIFLGLRKLAKRNITVSDLCSDSLNSMNQRNISLRQVALEDGFSQFYFDPHGIAKHTAAKLMAMMDTYEEEFISYVAPYTSLVQSSMMGKSRLMKEISRIIPCVYICL